MFKEFNPQNFETGLAPGHGPPQLISAGIQLPDAPSTDAEDSCNVTGGRVLDQIQSP